MLVRNRLGALFMPLLLSLAFILLSGFKFEGAASPVLYWGESPNEQQVRALKRMGIKTLINIRTNPRKKTRKIAEEVGLRFYKVHTGVWKAPGRQEMKAFLDIVCNPENQPVFLFCKGGRDRTAFYIALYRVAVDGWTPAQARAELRDHRVRKYWPVFWQYDDILEENLAWIREVGNEKRGQIATRGYTGHCECAEFDFKKLAKSDATELPNTLTSARKAMSH